MEKKKRGKEKKKRIGTKTKTERSGNKKQSDHQRDFQWIQANEIPPIINSHSLPQTKIRFTYYFVRLKRIFCLAISWKANFTKRGFYLKMKEYLIIIIINWMQTQVKKGKIKYFFVLPIYKKKFKRIISNSNIQLYSLFF